MGLEMHLRKLDVPRGQIEADGSSTAASVVREVYSLTAANIQDVHVRASVVLEDVVHPGRVFAAHLEQSREVFSRSRLALNRAAGVSRPLLDRRLLGGMQCRWCVAHRVEA